MLQGQRGFLVFGARDDDRGVEVQCQLEGEVGVGVCSSASGPRLGRPARKADRDASATLSRLRQAVGVEATTPNKLGWSLAQTGHAGPPHAPFEGDLTLHNPPS